MLMHERERGLPFERLRKHPRVFCIFSEAPELIYEAPPNRAKGSDQVRKSTDFFTLIPPRVVVQ